MAQQAEHPQAGGLESVYLAHRHELARFLRARGAGDVAEDLVQELWFKLKPNTRAPIADPLSYLYRAAHNLMISRHRAAIRGERRDGEWAALAPEDSDGSVEHSTNAKQEILQAEERLRGAGERTLKIFVMFRIEGISQPEIARRLGLSLSTIEKDLQRAYRAIAGLRDDLDAGDANGRRL